MLEQISICLTALYLRGLPRAITPVRRRWARIVSCLRSADCALPDMPSVFREKGFLEEAVLIADSNLVESARELLAHRAVLTAVDDPYPKRWMERLQEGAPPAVWMAGNLSTLPLIGVVGSRNIDRSARRFAEDIGREAIRLGYGIVSGGAIGSDLAAAKGAQLAGGEVLEILPHGIHRYVELGKCGLSVCAPDEEFSTASAMERNALIYAASEKTVVVEARFRKGGTWMGAFEATRRKLCPLIVRDNDTEASRALIGLGAVPLSDPRQLEDAIAQTPAQRGLFGIG